MVFEWFHGSGTAFDEVELRGLGFHLAASRPLADEMALLRAESESDVPTVTIFAADDAGALMIEDTDWSDPEMVADRLADNGIRVDVTDCASETEAFAVLREALLLAGHGLLAYWHPASRDGTVPRTRCLVVLETDRIRKIGQYVVGQS